jgi:hypothetical protein
MSAANDAFDREAIQRILEYGTLFDSPTGERVLEDLKKAFYFYRTTFVEGDSHYMARNEGGREVIVYIEQMVKYAKQPHLIPGAAALGYATHDAGDTED